MSAKSAVSHGKTMAEQADIHELYEPLLSLGLVYNRTDLIKLLEKVGLNSLGIIEFEDFLSILNQGKTLGSKNLLVDFFRDLANGRISGRHCDVPFQLLFSNRRRELMLNSYIGRNTLSKNIGKKVLDAFETELRTEHKIDKLERYNTKKQFEFEEYLRKNRHKNEDFSLPEINSSYRVKGRRLTRLEALDLI